MIFNFVALGLGVVGVLLTIYAIVKQSRLKRIGVSGRPPTELHKAKFPGLAITFNGLAVEDVHIFEVLFSNTGRVAIRPEDFSGGSPLSIRVGQRILTAEATLERNGVSEVTSADISGNQVVIPPLLLNARESVRIRGLVTSGDGSATMYEVSGRIANIPAIRASSGEPFRGRPPGDLTIRTRRGDKTAVDDVSGAVTGGAAAITALLAALVSALLGSFIG